MLRCAQHDSTLLSMTGLYFTAAPWWCGCAPLLVTLSAAKGLSRWVSRCFALLSMTLLYYCRAIASR